MYNLRDIDKVGMQHVMLFITEKLAEFDTKSVEWIKLLPLKKNTLLHLLVILYWTRQAPKSAYIYSMMTQCNIIILCAYPPYRIQHFI